MEKVVSFSFEGQEVMVVVDSPAMKNVVVSMGGFSADIKSTSGEFREAVEKALEEQGVSPSVGEIIEWSDRGPVGFVYSGEVIGIDYGRYCDNVYRVKVLQVLNTSGVIVPVSGNLEMSVPFSLMFAHKQVSGGQFFSLYETKAAEVVSENVVDEGKDNEAVIVDSSGPVTDGGENQNEDPATDPAADGGEKQSENPASSPAADGKPKKAPAAK